MPASPTHPKCLAGLPATISWSLTSFTTTNPVPTNAHLPILIGDTHTASASIEAPL